MHAPRWDQLLQITQRVRLNRRLKQAGLESKQQISTHVMQDFSIKQMERQDTTFFDIYTVDDQTSAVKQTWEYATDEE